MTRVAPKIRKVPLSVRHQTGQAKPNLRVETTTRQIRLGRIGENKTVILVQGDLRARRWALDTLNGYQGEPNAPEILIDHWTEGDILHLCVHATQWAPNTVLTYLADLWMQKGGQVLPIDPRAAKDLDAQESEPEVEEDDSVYSQEQMATALGLSVAQLQVQLELPNAVLQYSDWTQDLNGRRGYRKTDGGIEVLTIYTFDRETYDENIQLWEQRESPQES